MRLVAIGLAAGLFSALFGVGGGIAIVPLLLLATRFSERPAMATSLVSIGMIAAVGSVTYGLHGDVKLGSAALVGLPGAAGAVVGVYLQQRVASRWLGLAFAFLLAGVGAKLLVSP